jgi:hypothetical protein
MTDRAQKRRRVGGWRDPDQSAAAGFVLRAARTRPQRLRARAPQARGLSRPGLTAKQFDLTAEPRALTAQNGMAPGLIKVSLRSVNGWETTKVAGGGGSEGAWGPKDLQRGFWRRSESRRVPVPSFRTRPLPDPGNPPAPLPAEPCGRAAVDRGVWRRRPPRGQLLHNANGNVRGVEDGVKPLTGRGRQTGRLLQRRSRGRPPLRRPPVACVARAGPQEAACRRWPWGGEALLARARCFYMGGSMKPKLQL